MVNVQCRCVFCALWRNRVYYNIIYIAIYISIKLRITGAEYGDNENKL